MHSMHMYSEVPSHILDVAQEKFFAHGITRVTVTEIASDLRMSKKTLYKHVGSKDRLVAAVWERQIIRAMRRYWTITHSALGDADKLKNIFSLIGHTIVPISGEFQRDLRRLRPDLWVQTGEIRRQTVFADFARMLEAGITKGAVRSDAPLHVVVPAFIGALQWAGEADGVTPGSIHAGQTLQAVTDLFLHGILTKHSTDRMS